MASKPKPSRRAQPLYSHFPTKATPPTDDGWSQFELWAGQEYFIDKALTPPKTTSKPITATTTKEIKS